MIEVVVDEGFGDAGMLLDTTYDQTAGRLTIRGVSGTLTATVERLDVALELDPADAALHVRRRLSRLTGSESEVPLPRWPET